MQDGPSVLFGTVKCIYQSTSWMYSSFVYVLCCFCHLATVVNVVKSRCLCSRLQSEMSDLKSRWESDVAERSRENVARDVELNTLRDTDATFRAELSQRKHDIDRFVEHGWGCVIVHLLKFLCIELVGTEMDDHI